jgi:hypothetical protein
MQRRYPWICWDKIIGVAEEVRMETDDEEEEEESLPNNNEIFPSKVWVEWDRILNLYYEGVR